ncbi:MAG TPA: branched-chain amino acid ABC transporter permease [Thermodesulfobacteriota bacterium]|jgi:branched-chain amino acid transport system permease protein|nr:branched-chain amino acid ABC transporter permease [Thermodesulfobacteriota bacterium]
MFRNGTPKILFFWFAFILIAVLLPFLLPSYFVHILIMILFYGFLGTSWNILGGYAGQFSFGHAAFFGIGAYTSTLIFVNWGISPWIGMVFGGLLGMLLGLLMGSLCFHYGLKGPYFALATLAFAELLRLISLNLDLTGKAMGILIPLKGNALLSFQHESKIFYYFVILLMFIGVLWVAQWIDRGKIGDYFAAIREDEDSAEAIGVNTFAYKLLGILISSFLTALGGTFYAQYFLYIDPPVTFGVGTSIEIFLRPIVGGMGTVYGPIIGALVLGPLGEVTRGILGGYHGVHLMIYGAILVGVIVFLPKGIYGWLDGFTRRHKW